MEQLLSGQDAAGPEKKDDRSRHHTNRFLYGIKLGFFAGLIWGLVRWVLYGIKFTKVIPGFLAEPFFRHKFLITVWGHFLGLGFFMLFSIAAAYIYMLVFGRLRGPWWGVLYGFLWWLIMMAAVGPMWKMMAPVNRIGFDTIATELSVFVLWGVFIGYTIAFEFQDEASREPLNEQAASN